MELNFLKSILISLLLSIISLNLSGSDSSNQPESEITEVNHNFLLSSPDSFPSNCYASFWYNNFGTMVYFQNDSWSNNPIISCLWDFGDGTISSDFNPEHEYAAGGIYFVTLTISDGICSATTILEVWIDNIPPQDCYADFWVYSLGTTGFFNDMSWSIDSIDSWYWDFGDGNTSILQNPQHQYAAFGFYDVSLTITSDTCVSTTIFGIWLDSTIAFDCMAQYSYDYNPGNYNEIYFTDYSIAIDTITAWLWNFGDGNTSTAQNPTHEYLANGMYEVILTISSDSCENSVTDFIVIGNTPPGDCMADFSYYINPGNLVEFYDYSWSLSPISSWLWDFGDGSTSNLSYPVHTYASTGVYLVSLTIQADSCSHTAYYPVYVDSIIVPDCMADFSWNAMGLEVSFYDYSMSVSPITSWLWNFGDGQTSAQPNPVHNYANAGFYEVMLMIETDSCSSTMYYYLFVDSIINYDCQADFIFYPSQSNPLEIIFYDNSTAIDPIMSWDWDFGDGSVSIDPIAMHTYASAGDYLVRISIATNPITFPGDTCYSTYESWITVGGVDTCYALFSHIIEQNTAHFTDESTGNSQIVSWLWDFGDGNSDSDQNPTHQFALEGTYTVSLTITTESGCSNSFSQEIEYLKIDVIPDFQNNRLFPNPADEQISISTQFLSSRSIQISLMDLTSRIIMNKSQTIPQGDHTFSLDISKLPEGLYFILLDDGFQQEIMRFVK